MGRIEIGDRSFSFKSSFGEFTLETIKPYMDSQKQLTDLYAAIEKKLKEVETALNDLDNLQAELDSSIKEGKKCVAKCKNKDEQAEIERRSEAEQAEIGGRMDEKIKLFDQLNAESKALQDQIPNIQTQILIHLCKNPLFETFCSHTKEVDSAVIGECFGAVMNSLGNLDEFWNGCPCVESLTHRTHRKLLFFQRKSTFKVHTLDKTTLIRETMANVQAKAAMTNKNKLDKGIWDDICKFIAILVRPEKEADEIAFTNKSFINAYKLRGLDFQGKLTYYENKLNAIWEKREQQFKDLPLPIAIGVLKEYFKKKRN